MDLVKGDPDLVMSEGHDMRVTADALSSAARRLRDVRLNAESKATDALDCAIEELAKVLADAHERYRPAGEALVAYAPVLRRTMKLVEDARSAADQADPGGADRHADAERAKEVIVQANPFASQHDKDEAARDAQRARAHADSEAQAEASARAQYETAMSELHTAARAAAAQIEMGIDASGLNDRFKDRMDSIIEYVDKAIGAILEAIHKLLDFVALALAGLALALAVLGVTAPIALLVHALAQLVSLADLVVQTVRFARDEISLGEFLVSILLTLAGVLMLGGSGTAKTAFKIGSKAHTKEVLKKFGGVAQASAQSAADDPAGAWLESLWAPPCSAPPSYSDIDVVQITEDSGIDVPGNLEVAPPEAQPSLEVAPPAPTEPLEVAPPEQYPVQATVHVVSA